MLDTLLNISNDQDTLKLPAGLAGTVAEVSDMLERSESDSTVHPSSSWSHLVPVIIQLYYKETYYVNYRPTHVFLSGHLKEHFLIPDKLDRQLIILLYFFFY